MPTPSEKQRIEVLAAAGRAHHDYESSYLDDWSKDATARVLSRLAKEL